MEQQMDVTDLIPKGLGAYWCVFLGGSAAIGLSELAYRHVPLLCEKFGLEKIPPLDVTGSGSFLSWAISLLFILTAGVALINYRLGHKYKDPKARVSAWFWLAAAMMFLSMDSQVTFRETFRDILVTASGTSVYEDGTVWWLAIYAFALVVIGTRILLDMFAYLPSLGVFLLATGCAVGGVALEFGFVPVLMEPVAHTMLFTGLKSMAVLLYFLAFTLFARRQVFRDPEVALRWFAKVWNQTPILQTVEELKAVGGQPTPPVEPKPVAPAPTPPAPAAPTTAKPPVVPPPGIVAPAAGTASGISRPLVQKPAEAVQTGGAKKDDDFDLSLLR